MRPEALLDEATWLRRLAITLAGDEDDADDLVQESWIAAWRANPDSSRPLRPWLAKVVRDRSRMRRRADSRRARRESSIPDQDSAPGPDDVLDRVRLHRILTDLVLELDEPYRATILARFVEGLTSAELAKRLDVPDSTVRWRLREALARLRAGLDHRNGERRAWAPAVLAFAQKGGAVAKSAKTTLAILGLLVLLLCGAVFWARTSPGEEADPVPARDTRSKTADDSPTRDVLLELRSDARPPGWVAQEGAPSRRVAGMVIVDGIPAADADVRLEDEASRVGLVPPRATRTDRSGRFDFGARPATRFELGAYVTGRVAAVERVDLRDPRFDSEHIVVVLQPCLAGLYGRVLDASGGAIPQAEILVQGVIGTASAQDGAFDICVDARGEAPETRRVLIRASGYGSVELIAPLVGRVERDFMLSPESTITGRVVNARGEGVPMANVRVTWDEAAPRPGSEHPAEARAVTDPSGRFELPGLSGGRLRVQAVARGLGVQPVVIEIGAGDVKDVHLVMAERGVLRGRVTEAGRPVAGVRVFDRAELPTYLSRSQVLSGINEAVSQEDGTFVLDGLSIGTLSLGTSPQRLRSPTSIEVRPGEHAIELEVEGLGSVVGTVSRNGEAAPYSLVRAAGANWVNRRTVESDANGRFEFEGLEPDDYELNAYNPTLGAFGTTDLKARVEIGTTKEIDIELRFGARASGTIVDANGSKVRGAVVRFVSTTNDDQSRCVSDRAGRFSCGSMRGGRSYRVEVSGSEASPTPYAFVGAPPEPVSLQDGNDHVQDLGVVVDARSVRIEGVVVDHLGKPVVDARVFANPGSNPWSSVPTSVTNLRGQFELRDLPPGSYGLQAQALTGAKAIINGVAGGTSNVRFVIEPPSCDSSQTTKAGQRLREAPASLPNKPLARVVWDGSVELIGWEAPARVRLGEAFQITLILKVIKPLDRSWKIFVHAETPKVRVNGDHEPIGGQCLTSTWKAGDVIVDRVDLRLDPSFDRGTYEVWVGFFSGWEPSWKNLALSDAPDGIRDRHQRLKLTTIAATE